MTHFQPAVVTLVVAALVFRAVWVVVEADNSEVQDRSADRNLAVQRSSVCE